MLKLNWCALLLQGFTVALFYCFLNTEVQNTVRHHFETWKTRRSLGPSRLRSGSRSKDWSPRSRTESIRWVKGLETLAQTYQSLNQPQQLTLLLTQCMRRRRHSHWFSQLKLLFLFSLALLRFYFNSLRIMCI